MISKKDHSRLRNLLVDAISLLCRNGVPFRSVLRVDALVGITLDKNEVVLININENFPKGSDSDLETVESVDDGCQSLAGNKEETKTTLESTKCPATERICIASDMTTSVSGTRDFVNKVTDVSYDMQIDSGCEHEVKPMLAAEAKASCVTDDANEPSLPIKTEQPCFTDSNEQQSFISGFMCNTFNYNPSNAVSSVLLTQSQSCNASDWPVGVSSEERSPRVIDKDYTLPRHLKARARIRSTARGMPHRLNVASSPSGISCNGGRAGQSMSDRLGCHLCGAWLCSPQALRDHIRGTHFSMYSYVCDDCGMTFKWRSTLRSHRFSCPRAGHRSDVV